MSTKDEYFIDGRGMTAEEHDEALQRAQRDRSPKGSVLNVTMVSSSVLAGVQLERDHARHDAETWSARAVEAETEVARLNVRVAELLCQTMRWRVPARSDSEVEIQLAANIQLVDSLREKLIKQATNHNNQLAALQAQIDRSDAIVTERDEQLEAMVKALARSERELAVAASRLTKPGDDEAPAAWHPAKGDRVVAVAPGDRRGVGVISGYREGFHLRWMVTWPDGITVAYCDAEIGPAPSPEDSDVHRADLADICGCGRNRGSGVHARGAINGHAFVARRGG